MSEGNIFSMINRIYQRGFTLIEIVIVIAILGTLGVAGIVSLLSQRVNRDLLTTGQNALTVLRLAQSKTIAGEGNSQWGVHLDPSQFVLFRGSSYAGATSMQTFALPATVDVGNISLVGGGPDIIFTRISGTTIQSGSFSVRIKSDTAKTFSITIDPSGKVYQTGTAPTPAGTRIVDTRHRSFVLADSIQNATTMTLTFSDPPSPDTVSNIAMSPYFDGPKSKFDWSGNTTVGGQVQVLRIHTTKLTSSATTLSVDRDCRYNTKQVKIRFDENDVATFAADCKAVTVYSFGGIMSEP